MKSGGTQYYRGAVSIFVVVFTALLITIITVSFTRLMLREQQRATEGDVSQSAYDAALAGVEDAKRALTKYYQLPAGDPLRNVDLTKCNAISRILNAPSTNTSEVQVGDPSLNQSYTCVQVELRTNSYERTVAADETQLVSLRGVSSFDTVKIEWFSRDDISGGTDVDLSVPSGPILSPLTTQTQWSKTKPPVLETQMIQTGSSFNLDNFDSTTNGESNTNTLFLYPKELATTPSLNFAVNDPRKSPSNSPTDIQCVRSLTAKVYSCSTEISLPTPVGGGNRSNAFLRLTARYNSTHYKVSLKSGTNLVQFDGVQPAVDSTGKTSNIFRRVQARIEPTVSTLYPNAAIDVTGNLCKTLRVTNDPVDYDAGACTPKQP